MKRRDFLTSGGAAVGATLLSTTPLHSATNATPGLPTESAIPIGPNLNRIHDLMEQKCVDSKGNPQVGAFFSLKALVDNLQQTFRDNQDAIAQQRFPTPFDKINAGLEIDPGIISLVITRKGEITLSKFSPVIVLTEPGGKQRPYNKITIDFQPIFLELAADIEVPGKLRFYLVTGDPANPKFPKFSINPGNPNQTVLDDNKLSLADFQVAQ